MIVLHLEVKTDFRGRCIETDIRWPYGHWFPEIEGASALRIATHSKAVCKVRAAGEPNAL